MLFDQPRLRGIADGSVTLAFRRWDRPRVRPGAQQRTAAGVVEFTSVEPVADADVTADDARAAGFDDVASLLRRTRGRGGDRDGTLYRVGVRLAGEDPRLALRETVAEGDDLAALTAALDRLDRAADEPWTRAYLQVVADHEGVVARELAAARGLDRDLFKRRVRRLKDLGLTISLDVGYRISLRGRAFLDA